jgi:hypothetical protein
VGTKKAVIVENHTRNFMLRWPADLVVKESGKLCWRPSFCRCAANDIFTGRLCHHHAPGHP